MLKTGTVCVKEIGRVHGINKSVIKVEGFHHCAIGQLVHFPDHTKGFVMSYNPKEVLVLLLGRAKGIRVGDTAYSEAESFTVPVGERFLGRLVNALCEPLDRKDAIEEDASADIFSPAPAVLDRVPISQMLSTGIRTIDSCIPIGKGQRELIIGDRMTGKTTLALDTILNQKDKDVVCVYCCIGRDFASFKKAVQTLKAQGSLGYTLVVAALASSPIGEQYLAPYAAACLGEYFMRRGRDVCVVFDDLTKHAWAYRELSLLLDRPPGREAYPGDIFYVHAQLMERAAKLSPEMGGGSMSFLPIADTIQGDFTGFIPTNLISMTDGQIYLNSTLFSEGFKPAIDLGLSVSRIGNKVQSFYMKEISRDIGLGYIQYRELLKSTKLRAMFSEDVASRIKHGEKIEQILIQKKNKPSPSAEQILFFYALKKGVLDVLSHQECERFKDNILEHTRARNPEIMEWLEKGEALSEPLEEELKRCIAGFFK